MNEKLPVGIGIREPGFKPEIDCLSLELSIERCYDFPELESRLKETPLLSLPGFYPYRLSQVSLEEIPVIQLHPCSLYVLKSLLDFTRGLREKFLEKGVDTLRLNEEASLIEYSLGGSLKSFILPPIVEVSEDDGGILVIVDGLHRTVVAKEQGLPTITTVVIRDTACPIPAMPVSWEEIRVFDQVPPTQEKRRFRFRSLQQNLKWSIANYNRFVQGFDPNEIEGREKYFFYRSLSHLKSPQILQP